MASQKIIQSDCLDGLRTLADGSIQCCVTSPPYWGLRDYGRDGQIGLEATPTAYVERIVEVFREVRRVLRDDGTLWLNIGDSYAAARGGTSMPAETLAGGVSGRGDLVAKRGRESGYTPHRDSSAHGLKHKDLVGIPWRVAFALQADGWYLRQDIIWHKPNPMPESVRDRCTKAHEYVFLLAKSERYYYDADAVSEQSVAAANGRGSTEERKASGRNRRSVWKIATKPYRGAHFATMPPQLAETCLLAGTSEAGCCSLCGTPHERVVDRKRVATRPGTDTKVTGDKMTDGNRDPERHVTTTTTTGWRPTCSCNASASPCTVLDPFGGSGTTLAVAAELGLNGVGFELNDDYIKLAEERIAKSRDKAPLFTGPPCPSGDSGRPKRAATFGTIGRQAVGGE
jgi:site-specific DNA-methyltransferase (adenine-specific)